MTAATPTVAAVKWIAQQFVAAGAPLDTVSIFVAVATEETPRPRRDTAGPYVTLRHFPASDLRYLGGRMAGSRLVIEITAWDEGTDTSRVAPIVEAFHGAIDAKAGLADGVRILSCLRQAPVEGQVEEDNKLFTRLGGEYRIRTAIP